MSACDRLIFVSGGHRFASGHSGLALRTRLALDLLSEAWRDKEKHLIAAPCEELREMAIRAGWKVHFVRPYSESASTTWRIINRWKTLLFAHWSKSAGMKAMTMLGGSDMPPEVIADIIHSIKPSTVWLSRCDLLHIVRWVHPSYCRLIVDTNDTVLNLVRCYRPRSKLCRITGWSQRRLQKKIRFLELEAAKRCDRIIAISREDLDYYSATDGVNIELEETCVISGRPSYSSTTTFDFDVGFIGGAHLGSINAALNFLRISSRIELKNYSFAVAGGVCDALKSHKRSDNVNLLGKVADAYQFLSRCRQVVLWSSGETGTSVKFQEAIISGVTVLANSAAARWSAAVPGRDYVLCDDEEALVASVMARIKLPPSPLRECLRGNLVKRFSTLSSL
jgi:hypothetical protein